MRSQIHPFPENSLVGNCIRLAQTTFFDACRPAPTCRFQGAGYGHPRSPSRSARAWPAGRKTSSNWLYRQRMNDRDACLAQSQDVFELERRLRDLDRRPYF